LDAVALESGDIISEHFEEQIGRGCMKNQIVDLCVAVIATAELMSCSAS
jgi:hypothetical protein